MGSERLVNDNMKLFFYKQKVEDLS